MRNAFFALLASIMVAACTQSEGHQQQTKLGDLAQRTLVSLPDTVVKTDAEWKAQLTREQYRVIRQQGTERAFSGKYDRHKEKGVYHCLACNLELFASETKFDSGTGWPSFYAPIKKENVTLREDRSFGGLNYEVVCSRCAAHLGHVFDDGPKPTGLRYCMNSVALNFEKR